MKGGLTNQSPSENHSNPSSDSEPTLHHYQNLQVLPLDLAVCQTAANLYKNLKSRGLLIEPEDLFIATTALYHDLKLATSHLKHFSRVEGL